MHTHALLQEEVGIQQFFLCRPRSQRLYYCCLRALLRRSPPTLCLLPWYGRQPTPGAIRTGPESGLQIVGTVHSRQWGLRSVHSRCIRHAPSCCVRCRQLCRFSEPAVRAHLSEPLARVKVWELLLQLGWAASWSPTGAPAGPQSRHCITEGRQGASHSAGLARRWRHAACSVF